MYRSVLAGAVGLAAFALTGVYAQHPLARPEFDAGAVSPETRLERMILVLKSSAAQQQALADLLAAQQDPGSPLYHQWLTPQSFGERFGVPSADLDRSVSWLGAQGFSIEELPAGGRAVVFSGTAGQVQEAFHSAIHRYHVQGQEHIANATEPRVPQELADVVAGVLSLNDFRRKAMHAAPAYSAGGGYYYLAPADYATIYDIASLYAGGITGAGQSLAIVARCNIPMTDVETFRQTFGLPSNNPNIIVNGADPGITSEDELAEADLDVQWSGAVAPQATVNLVVSKSTQTTDGVDLSAQYIVSHNLAPVMSTSFGSCEQYMAPSELTFYYNLWQQAAAQGITAMISAGDSGAAGCDLGGESTAVGGLAVNGLCSSPYSVCVGGTEFNEGANPGQYWSTSNGQNGASAIGYIPEVVWNESGSNSGSGLWAGGGGASVVYPKPSWQTGTGVPNDGARDVPDVSLTAASHDGYLLYLDGYLMVIAGTSAASPSFAGIMTLVNQQTGSSQGNGNPSLYALAALQQAGGRAYFHDITVGNNSVPGQTGFSAGTGYDRASGLGSVDAAVLVNHWSDAASGGVPGITLGVNPGMITLPPGGSWAASVQVNVTGGFDAPVSLSASGAPSGVTTSFAPTNFSAPGSGTSVLTINVPSSAAAGQYAILVSATGGNVTQTFKVTLVISSNPGCVLASTSSAFTLTPGSSATAQITCGLVTGGFNAALKLAVTGVPQGVSFSASPSTVTPGSGSSKATISASSSATAGTYTFSLVATGGGLSLSLPMTLTIDPPPAFSLNLGASTLSVLQGTPGQVAVTTSISGAFDAAVALSISGLPPGVTASFSPTTILAPGSGTSTLTIQVAGTSTAGTYALTVKGAGGGITKTQTLQLTAQVQPSFNLAVSPKTLTVGQGATGAVTATISGLSGGFNAPVSLAIATAGGGQMPKGLNPKFTPATISTPGSGASILSFAPDSSSTPGVYLLTVTAGGDDITQTAAVSLTVTPPPSFSVQASSSTLNILAGGSAGTQISAAAVYGFNSTVTLSAGSLPSGVGVTFSPASISGNGGKSTINVLTTGATAPGVHTLNISATGGGVTAALSITLNAGRLTLTPAASAIMVKPGSSGALGISTGVTGVYTGTVTLAATNLPKGITASFSPSTIGNPAAGTSNLKLTAASSTTPGTYTITVGATSDSITQSANISLTVQ